MRAKSLQLCPTFCDLAQGKNTRAGRHALLQGDLLNPGIESTSLTSPAVIDGRPGFDPWVGKIPWRRKCQTHSSIVAWRIPWTEEPGGLQSTGSQRVGHNWGTSLSLSLFTTSATWEAHCHYHFASWNEETDCWVTWSWDGWPEIQMQTVWSKAES